MSSKKKKQKKEQEDLILLVGDVLDEKYKKLTEEIFVMQEEVKREQKREERRAYKYMKKHNELYLPAKAKLREATIAKLEGNWLDQLIQFLGELKPLLRAIASCIMQLIVSLLSIDAVKYRCSPNALAKMQRVFHAAKQTSEALAVA
jgi:hypothetical protein